MFDGGVSGVVNTSLVNFSLFQPLVRRPLKRDARLAFLPRLRPLKRLDRIGAIIDAITWEGPFEGWTHRFLKKNYWRVQSLMDYDDAIQECALVFSHLRVYYRQKIDNPKWLMSLFQVSVRNRWHTLSNYNSAEKSKKTLVSDVTSVLYNFAYDLADSGALSTVDCISCLKAKPKNLSRSKMMEQEHAHDHAHEVKTETIYQELVRKLGLSGQESPDEIVTAIAKLPDEAWNALSEDAQGWYDESVKALEAKTAMPELPGWVPPVEGDDGDGDDNGSVADALAQNGNGTGEAIESAEASANGDGEKPKVKRGRKAKAEGAPKEKKEAKVKVPRAKHEASGGVPLYEAAADPIFDYIVGHLDQTAKEMAEALSVNGLTVNSSTIPGYVIAARRTIGSLKRQGQLQVQT